MSYSFEMKLKLFDSVQQDIIETSYRISIFIKKNADAFSGASPHFCFMNEARGGSSIVKVPGDVPPARVYFFGLLV